MFVWLLGTILSAWGTISKRWARFPTMYRQSVNFRRLPGERGTPKRIQKKSNNRAKCCWDGSWKACKKHVGEFCRFGNDQPSEPCQNQHESTFSSCSAWPHMVLETAPKSNRLGRGLVPKWFKWPFGSGYNFLVVFNFMDAHSCFRSTTCMLNWMPAVWIRKWFKDGDSNYGSFSREKT